MADFGFHKTQETHHKVFGSLHFHHKLQLYINFYLTQKIKEYTEEELKFSDFITLLLDQMGFGADNELI